MDKHQYDILTRRYMNILFSDFFTLLIFIGQVPLIGAIIGWRWGSINPSDTFYFVIALTGLWIGTSTSCRELVKEKEIFIIEKFQFLKETPYLFSKYTVLFFVACIQTGLFYFAMFKFMKFKGLFLMIIGTLLGMFSGVVLGLFISAVAKSSDQAVILVPVFLIPQLLFSDIILPGVKILGKLKYLNYFFPLKWFNELIKVIMQSKLDYKLLAENSFFLILTMVFYSFATWLILKNRR